MFQILHAKIKKDIQRQYLTTNTYCNQCNIIVLDVKVVSWMFIVALWS